MTGQSNLKDHFVLVILVFLFLGSGILLINKFFWDGYLIIESNVLGSKISIDGKHYGDSPLYLGVSPGLHKLKVESSDHAAHIENFKINGGETKKLFRSLRILSFIYRGQLHHAIHLLRS